MSEKPSALVPCHDPLDPAARAELARWSGPAPRTVPELAALLARLFRVDLARDPDVVRGYARDESNLPGSAEALARPGSAAEAAAVLAACRAGRIPVTLSGKRSNLTGSATPDGGVLLSLERLAGGGVAVDEPGRTARPPVGMVLEEFRQAALAATERRLAFPVDPTSRADASVGGALACNASGFVPGWGGAMRAHVRELEVVFPNGWIVPAPRGRYVSEAGRLTLACGGERLDWPVPVYPRPAIKNASGPFSSPDGRVDLVDLFVGAEGIFGLITGAVLALAPPPEDSVGLVFSLPTEPDAVRCRAALAANPATPLERLLACEYFGPHCREVMEHAATFFREGHAVALYLEVPVAGGDVEAAVLPWMEAVLAAGCGVAEDGLLLVDNDRTRKLFLEARHSAPAKSLEIAKQRGSITVMTDAVVPAPAFGECLDLVRARLEAGGIPWLSFGHFGDCHVHVMQLPDKSREADALAAYDDLIALSARLGGVYSGEHGTGKRKRRDFARCYGPEAVGQVRRSKAALDPDFLVNRGNVVEPPPWGA